jgi:predicted AlkP superfamily phosphohydrolase/phosphomutase
MPKRKVLIIGLDSLAPQLAFEEFLPDLPTLAQLMRSGWWGSLRSTDPPITVPAWASMTTGKDPGVLGIYGFRNRKDYSYDSLYIANSLAVKEPTLWSMLSRNRMHSVLVGIPQTYPPKPLRGHLITDFLAPDTQSNYTYPEDLKDEVEKVTDGYIIDVKDFRTDNKDWLIQQIYEMTDKRFRLVRHLVNSKPWDFFMFVEMGPDRLQHGFWRYCDPEHRLYQAGNPYENVLRDYYRYLDAQIADLLGALNLGETVVLIVSDHGAKRMHGGICVNEWLQQEGYLCLKSQPQAATRLTADLIDWPRTRVWGEGGYYCRLFFNVKGREPQGTVEPNDYDGIRNELIEKLQALGDQEGNPIGTIVHKPENLYQTCNNIAPDLIVYFGDLNWRSVGIVGVGTIHTLENDTGPDDANHDYHGVFVMVDPDLPENQRGLMLQDLSLYDIAPTVLNRLGLIPPQDMLGKIITAGAAAESR